MPPAARLIEGVTWEALAADRRAHRLRRGKHFRGDVRALQRDAEAAASELGLAVRTVRDDFRKYAYLWVQFLDYAVPLGDPCPRCGSREILRTHDQFGRCPRCDATLAFVPGVVREDRPAMPQDVSGADDPALAGAATVLDRKTARKLSRMSDRRLDQFDVVEELVLDPDDSDDEREVWYGLGRYAGEDVLLSVIYPLVDGARQAHPERPGEDLYYVGYWHLWPYERAVRLGVLEG